MTLTSGKRPFLGVAVVALLSFVIALLRSTLRTDSDSGVFLAMFDGARDGRRLFVDLFDHKDPLFYYAGALQLELGGVRGVFVVQCLFVAVIGGSVYWLGTASGLDRASSAVVALVTVGAVGELDLLTTTPAVALLFLSTALLFANHGAWAGAALACMVGYKLGFGLFVLPLAIVAPMVLDKQERKRLATSGVAVFGLLLIVVALRGEFVAYIDAVRFNIDYPNTARAALGVSAGPAGSLARIRIFVEANPAKSVVFLVFVFGGCVEGLRILTSSIDSPTTLVHSRALAALLVSTTVAVLVWLAFTFLWPHHYAPAVFPMAIGAIIVLQKLASRPRVMQWLALGFFVLAAGISTADARSLGELRQRWAAPSGTIAGDIDSFMDEGTAQPIRYAVVDVNGPGIVGFLPDRFELVCRHFYQLPWFEAQGRLDEHVACIRDQANLVIEIESSYFAATEEWQQFRSNVETVLDRWFDSRSMKSGGRTIVIHVRSGED